MPAQPRTVLIAGNYGFGNAGDEAILIAMVADLRCDLPDLRIVVVSGNPEETRVVRGVETVPWQDVPAVIDAVRNCDLIVLGGGGLFFDYWGVRPEHMLSKHHTDLAYWTEYALLAALLDKPLMIYAAGVGPLPSEASRAFTRLAFEQATIATVRDPGSKALLESIGVPAEHVQVTADPAFGLAIGDPREGLRTLAPLAASLPARPLLGVALRNWDIGVTQEDWEREVAEALDAFSERYGGTIAFVPFQSAAGQLTDDAAVAQRVANRMRHAARSLVLPADTAVEQKAAVLGSADLVLAMRLHAVILAAASGVPTVGLSYDPKVRHTLERLDCAEYAMDLSVAAAAPLTALLDRAYSARDALRARIRPAAARLAGLGRRNAARVAEVLQRPPVTRAPSAAMIEWMKSLQLTQAMHNHALQQSLCALREQLAEGERAAAQLEVQLAERALAVGRLEQSLSAQAQQMAALQGELGRETQGRHELATRLTQREVELQALQREAEHRLEAIRALQRELAQIKGTRGWQWLERYRRLRDGVRGGRP